MEQSRLIGLQFMDTKEAATQREKYLQLQLDGQMSAGASWQREAMRLKSELEKLLNPTDADCECGGEYAEQYCPVHGVLRLLLDLRAEHAEARAEIERLRAELTTPCGDVREGLFGVTFTCERNLGHGGMHRDAESGAGWTYSDPSGSRN